jgi:Cu(I)/Ag(I) efflux system membrane fusion protein
MLYRIADLDPIWLYLDVYEYDLSWVRFGQRVDVFVEAYPGESFEGTVTFIDPFLDDKTRTVKARVNLKNPGGRLKPAMYGSAVIRVRLDSDGRPEPTGLEGKYICPMHPEIIQAQPGRCPICGMPLEKAPELRTPAPRDPHAGHGGPPKKESGKVLAIPSSAVLDTGIRQIAYRQTEAGGYELVELKLGPAAQGKDDRGRPAKYYPILAGLKAGDRVVTQGGFLIDSQRQIEGQPSLLFPAGQGGASLHSGHAMPAGGEHKH